jgi:putative two-component system response regulator
MLHDIFPDARILIVDDQPANVSLLERLLRQTGYADLHTTTDSRQVIGMVVALQPDIVLLDLHMPQVDGFAVLQDLRALLPPEEYFPILVLTADVTPQAKQRALTLGANDFVTKPFDMVEVLLRIRTLLATRSLHRQLQQQAQVLEERVQERTAELAAAQIEIVERLAQAAEYRDDVTGQHTQRVGRAAARMAAALGLPKDDVDRILRAAPLHDVGKIGIPDAILLKRGKLTVEEFDHMKRHTTIGARLLAGSRHMLLQCAAEIALTHHERWDGSGYPRGLRGTAIPLNGRIVAVADVFDALTSERPYKRAWSTEEALAEIQRQSGRQFDPDVVAAFMRLHRQGTTITLQPAAI